MADGELSKPPTPRDNGTYTLIEKFHRKEIPICIKPTLVNLVKSQTVIQPKLTGLPPIQTSSISFADVVKGHTYQDPSVLAQSKPKESSYSTQSFASEEMVKGVSTTQMVASIETEENQFLPILELHGKPAVFFPIERKPELVDKLKYVLVGKFSHDRPLWTRLKTFFHDLKLQGAFNVSIYDNKHIFIECSCKVDFDKIWLNLSWSIDGYIMRVFKWGYDFNPMKESSIVPVWIRMVGVPLHLFDEKTLWQISNIFGKPIKVDPRNVNRSMLNHARVCVQLDIEKPLIDSCCVGFIANGTGEIVESYCVKIFYDYLPSYCSSCAHIGHKTETCKRIQTLVSTGADSDVIGLKSRNLAVEQASTSVAIDHQRTGKDKCKMEVWQPVCIRKKDQKAIPAGELILDQPLARFNDLAYKSDISGVKDVDVGVSSDLLNGSTVEILHNEAAIIGTHFKQVSKTKGAKVDIIASQQIGGANSRSLATDQGTQNGAHVVAVKTDLSGPTVGNKDDGNQTFLDSKTDLDVESTSQKDHITASFVAASCSAPPQAATTVWIPVKKSSTAVENRPAVEKKCSTVAPLASENRFDCLNLQDGEASKASDKANSEVPAEQFSPGVQISTNLGHLQQGTEQTKKHKQQNQIITGCSPSWDDQMEKVDMKANKVRQAETPNTLHKNSGKNNFIEHQNKAIGRTEAKEPTSKHTKTGGVALEDYFEIVTGKDWINKRKLTTLPMPNFENMTKEQQKRKAALILALIYTSRINIDIERAVKNDIVKEEGKATICVQPGVIDFEAENQDTTNKEWKIVTTKKSKGKKESGLEAEQQSYNRNTNTMRMDLLMARINKMKRDSPAKRKLIAEFEDLKGDKSS